MTSGASSDPSLFPIGTWHDHITPKAWSNRERHSRGHPTSEGGTGLGGLVRNTHGAASGLPFDEGSEDGLAMYTIRHVESEVPPDA